MLGAVLLLFPSGFLCAFLFVFSLLFELLLLSLLLLLWCVLWCVLCVFKIVGGCLRDFWASPPPPTGEGGQRLMTADWGLITAAGEAYDSGRGADHRSGKGL